MRASKRFVSLTDELNAFLRECSPPAEAWFDILKAEWSALVGDTVAARATPARIEQHVLTVNVHNHAWLTELRSGLGRVVQAKVHDRTDGAITRINWQFGREDRSR